MVREIPRLHQELGLSFWWDRHKLWQLESSIVSMPLTELEWLLVYPFWNDGEREMVLSPLEVAEHPTAHTDQYRRTMAADLSYPICVIFLNHRWLVMDGMHRLLKAKLLGQETILAKQIREEHIPLIRRDEPEFAAAP